MPTKLRKTDGTFVSANTLAAGSVQGEAVADPSAISAYAAVVNMADPVTKAQGEAVSAALATLRTEVNALRTTVVDLKTSLEDAGVIDS